ncbi:SDR family oxidoreductase [Pikeienuella piscinae]|uniref:SDR family oxidoreductase n=1 Tax=Pikeienuella piscinae TaxID=2748098 RepID=A0A7L5BVU2_9RHOB|nr:SDR family oxidoreductase [Pikeienuella piscinae]QIE56500.1 SDR family oxidoreductase [Pikeienuella piscinae]
MSDENRTVIITGASRGIGAATARLAAARGYRVCVNYSSDAAGAASVVDDIRKGGGGALAFRADTSDEAAVVSMFDEASARLGPVTDLVNNAGQSGGTTRLEDLDAATLRRIFEVNVIGYFLCCREAVRRMSTRNGGEGGRIVNVSSVAAVNGSAGERIHYAATKGAVNSMGVGLAKEVAREGIRVNTFSPGLTWTSMNPPGRLEKLESAVPACRAAQPEEMARGVLWLLSDEADYVLGANLVMSGGR